jgi:uncharacterized repeat protein (TIGR03803 family)
MTSTNITHFHRARTFRTRVALTLTMLMLLVAAATTMAQAPTYSVLYNLASHTGDPWYPTWIGLFAQGRDGNLYSTSQAGDLLNGQRYGTVFQLTPAGSVTVLHSFTVGGRPNGGLTLGTDGSLYGTSVQDGTVYGTVFKITTSGEFTVLHNFNGTPEGSGPRAAPIQGTDGNFYGTTYSGGKCAHGTVYKMTPSGKLTVLYTFGCSAGSLGGPAALIQGTDGNFYGTTIFGGGHPCNGGCGGIYKMTPAGKLTVLHSFIYTDGEYPDGAIIQASDGNFYGTTARGNYYGTIYKMTPAGGLNVIHDFKGDALGAIPQAGLVQATDGKFYGAAETSNGTGPGVLFQITSTGTYSVVHSFKGTDGRYPEVSLFQHTNGTLYGDTSEGGGGTLCPNGAGCGVLYSLSMGLGPFVHFLHPQSLGKVGASIGILGQGFTGTTSVSFNGTPATFTVSSDTYLTAKVPAGATTGPVSVATAGGNLTSDQTFRVTPVIKTFNPTSGPVGTSVVVTGGSFTQATTVKFGSKSASFNVNSDTQVTATVPTGAKTGKIVITTPGGTASSATSFTVTP